MKRMERAGAGLLACVLASSVVVGCNGGDDGGPVPLPTATPTTGATAAPTASATAQPTQAFAAPVTLGSGQSGVLNLSVRGTQISGSLRVNARTGTTTARTGSNSLFSFTIPAGVYAVTGTFAPPRTFNISGAFPAPIGNFSINGTIPTQALPGAFTVRANGQTASGSIPALSTLPTPTPIRTATPAPTAGPTAGPTTPGTVGTTNLVFSGVSGSNFTPTAITSIDSVPSAILLSGSFGSGLTARLESGTGALRRSFGIQAFQSGSLISTGSSLPATGAVGASNSILIQLTETRSNFGGAWRSSGGTVRFLSVSDSRATLKLENVTMVPNTPGQLSGTGNFTLNGTLSFNFQRVSGT